MARIYSAQGRQAAATGDSILALVSATTIRPKVFEIGFGSPSTPADQAFCITNQRFAGGAGTGTACAEVPYDSADPAASATAFEAHSAEPTYTSGIIPHEFSINQQATYRWVVLPQYGIVLPAANDGGLGAHPTVISGGTPNLDVQYVWEE